MDPLDYYFLLRKLARDSCPICRQIVPDPLLSQAAFSHRFDPRQYHECRARHG
jgi:hypothetical protein